MSRPLSLKACAECGVERPSSLLRPAAGQQGKPGVCFVCVPTAVKTAEWAMAQEATLRARHDRLSRQRTSRAHKPKGRTIGGLTQGQLMTQLTNLRTSIEKEEELIAFFASNRLPRCSCCHTAESVQTDSSGTPWCPVCAHYVFVCGRCPAHASQVFFPQLADNPEPPPHPSLLPPVDYAFSGVDEIEEA